MKHFLALCLAATACFLSRLSVSGEALMSIPVTVDGFTKSLDLLQGESPETAALNFAQQNNLLQSDSKEHVESVVSQLAGMIYEKAKEREASGAQASGAAATPTPTVAFTIPVKLDNADTEVKVYNGKTPEESITAYFEEYRIPNEMRTNIYGQLVQSIQQKVEALEQQAKAVLMFTVPITMDNQQLQVHHYEGGNVLEEARQACVALGITAPEVLQNVIPQIAEVLQQRLNEVNAEKTMLFSIPINIDGKEIPMPYYENQTPQESVLQFLQSQGIVEEAVITRYSPSLIQMIEQYLENMKPREPIVTIPLNILGQERTYQYYEEEKPDRSILNFLQQIGLTNQADINDAAGQILQMLQTRLSEIHANKKERTTVDPSAEPVAVLPITLGDKMYNISLFPGEKEQDLATSFCMEHWVKVKQELGEKYTDEDVRECILIIETNLRTKVAETASTEGSVASEETKASIDGAVEQVTSETLEASDVPLEGSDERTEKMMKSTSETGSVQQESEHKIPEKVTEESPKETSTPSEPTSPTEETDGEKTEKSEERGQAMKDTMEMKVEKSEGITEGEKHPVEKVESIESVELIEEESEEISATTVIEQSEGVQMEASINPDGSLKTTIEKAALFTWNIDLGEGQTAELAFHEGDDPSNVAKQFCVQNQLDMENIPSLVDMIQAEAK